MWPDGGRSTTVSLTLTSIDDIDLIDIAITVPVVRCPVVDNIFCLFDGLDDHLTCMLVITIGVVAAIVAIILRYGDGANDVEVKFKLTTALSLEIVGHRTLELALVIVLAIGNLHIQRAVVTGVKLLILIVHQDDNTFLLALVGGRRSCAAAFQTLHALLVNLLAAHLGPLYHGLGVDGNKDALRLAVGLPVGPLPIVTVLVADKCCLYFRTVGQHEGLCHPTLSGYSHHRHGNNHE